MAKILRRIWTDRRGLSALEFALFLPVVATIIVGVIEFGRQILVTQKLQNAAFAVADLTARDDTLTEGQLADIFVALDLLMQPFTFGPRGTAFVSLVRMNASGQPGVVWQRRGSGTLSAASALGAQGGSATLPATFALARDETVIAVEVVYAYQPLFGPGSLSRTFRHQAFLRPRTGTLDTIAP